ncbi:hypothetical protein [Mycobacterium sp.]|uniref:hypothetical protein n=1 Tax=Mycobacterium sp. TaxID=1785 RepID=UPI003BA8E252
MLRRSLPLARATRWCLAGFVPVAYPIAHTLVDPSGRGVLVDRGPNGRARADCRRGGRLAAVGAGLLHTGNLAG